MTLRTLAPEPLTLLDEALARAQQVVDPGLWAVVRARIDHTVADGPEAAEPTDDRGRAVAAVVDQMLLDVASLDDDTVRAADRFFPPGGLADVVMAAYAYEARTRLSVVSGRLLGGLG